MHPSYPLTLRLRTGWRAERRRILPVYETFRFRIRAITRREHRRLQQEPSPFPFQERLLRAAVLEHPSTYRGAPWEWDGVLAGLVHQLAQEILQLSGFGDTPDPRIMTEVRDYLASAEARYDQLILLAFDAYTLEGLQDLHPADYHMLVGQAMWKLQLLGLDPDVVLDPEGYAGRAAAAPTLSPEAALQQAHAGALGQPGHSRGRNRNIHTEIKKEAEFTFINEQATPQPRRVPVQPADPYGPRFSGGEKDPGRKR